MVIQPQITKIKRHNRVYNGNKCVSPTPVSQFPITVDTEHIACILILKMNVYVCMVCMCVLHSVNEKSGKRELFSLYALMYCLIFFGKHVPTFLT
jgi:hypothetical protein